MKIRCVIHGFLLAALLAAPGLSLCARDGLYDLNGDASVDVLDLQRLVSTALAPSALAGDVNGDGRVDILDLQAALGDRPELPGRPSVDRPAAALQAVTPPRTPVPTVQQQYQAGPVLPAARRCPPEQAAAGYVASAVARWEPEAPPGTAGWRYLLGVSPHAPPAGEILPTPLMKR